MNRTCVLVARNALVLSCAAHGVVGCGSGAATTPAEGTVGAEGGQVLLNDGAGVTVPPGALASPVLITVAPGADPGAAPGGLAFRGPVLRLGPEGQAFLLPVTVTVQNPGQGDRVLTRPLGGAWTILNGVSTPRAGALSVAVSHFSEFVAAGPVTEQDAGPGGAGGNSAGGADGSSAGTGGAMAAGETGGTPAAGGTSGTSAGGAGGSSAGTGGAMATGGAGGTTTSGGTSGCASESFRYSTASHSPDLNLMTRAQLTDGGSVAASQQSRDLGEGRRLTSVAWTGIRRPSANLQLTLRGAREYGLPVGQSVNLVMQRFTVHEQVGDGLPRSWTCVGNGTMVRTTATVFSVDLGGSCSPYPASEANPAAGTFTIEARLSTSCFQVID